MAETVVARLKAVLTGDSAGLRRDLDQSEKRLKAFGDKAGQVGRQMTTRLTLPLVGVGVAAVKTASDFERSMTSIRRSLPSGHRTRARVNPLFVVGGEASKRYCEASTIGVLEATAVP